MCAPWFLERYQFAWWYPVAVRALDLSRSGVARASGCRVEGRAFKTLPPSALRAQVFRQRLAETAEPEAANRAARGVVAWLQCSLEVRAPAVLDTRAT